MQLRDEVSFVKRSRSETANKKQVHDDICVLIFEKMDWIDRFRATALFKNCVGLMAKIPNKYELNQGKFPWLFNHNVSKTIKTDCLAKLLDESSKRSYITESYGRSDHETTELLFGATSCASKFGWILMERKNGSDNTDKFFVYCPFNRKLLKLPAVMNVDFKRATFSSNPTSPDCVFFLVFAYSEWIEIRTCQIGDDGWKTFKIELTIPFKNRHVGRSFDVEYINDLLYVVFANTNTDYIYGCTFDFESEEWELMKTDGKILIWPKPSDWYVHLVTYKTDLYLACKGTEWVFFKYEMGEKEWVEQPSLGDRVLFLGCSSFLVDAVGELNNLDNNMFNSYYDFVSYPFSFTFKRREYDCKFYVDSRNLAYMSTWVTPTF